MTLTDLYSSCITAHLKWEISSKTNFYFHQSLAALLNQTILLPVYLAVMKYSMSDSEDEFDDWGKKDAPKRKAVISDDDDDTSFAPEPSTMADSDVDSPVPPPKPAPEPT